jgi:hypothetical protein
MADCQRFQDAVDQAQQLLDDHDCSGITNPFERRLCIQLGIQLKNDLARAKLALQNCQSGLPEPGVRRATGNVSFLRVHDGGGFGPPDDHLDVEVIFKLDTQPNRAFGFGLDDDAAGPAHDGMLGLLRDAMAHGLEVATDYRQVLGKRNSIAFRIEVTPPDDGGLRGVLRGPVVVVDTLERA